MFRPDCVKAVKTAKPERTGIAQPLADSEMATPSRYLEAPRRLRAFVRAHETSLVVLAAMIGTIGGLVVLAMSVAVAALHALLFDIGITERLSSQPSIETLRAVLVPESRRPGAGGGLAAAAALAACARDRPDRGQRPAWRADVVSPRST